MDTCKNKLEMILTVFGKMIVVKVHQLTIRFYFDIVQVPNVQARILQIF